MLLWSQVVDAIQIWLFHLTTTNLQAICVPRRPVAPFPCAPFPRPGNTSKILVLQDGESSIQIHPTFKNNNNQVYNHQDCKKYLKQKSFLLYKNPFSESFVWNRVIHSLMAKACPMLDIRPCGKRRSWDTRAAQAAVGWRQWRSLAIRIGNGKFLAGGSQFATLQGLGKGENRVEF